MQGFYILVICLLSANVCFCCLPTTEIKFGLSSWLETTEQGDLPFLVALIDPKNPEKLICSGTLISRTLVLTLKKCVQKHSEVTALFAITEFPPDVGVEFETRTFTHENITTYNDLALLRCTDPIEISDDVEPIDLASKDVIHDFVGSDASTSFWENQQFSKSILLNGYGQIVSLEPKLDVDIGDWADVKQPIPNSGSPLFIADDSGQSRLVGINSQSIQQSFSFFIGYTATFTTNVHAWLQSNLAACDCED